MTYEDICTLCPEVDKIINSYPKDKNPWVDYGDGKRKLSKLVGWFAFDSDHEELKTDVAYDIVTDELIKRLKI